MLNEEHGLTPPRASSDFLTSDHKWSQKPTLHLSRFVIFYIYCRLVSYKSKTSPIISKKKFWSSCQYPQLYNNKYMKQSVALTVRRNKGKKCIANDITHVQKAMV